MERKEIIKFWTALQNIDKILGMEAEKATGDRVLTDEKPAPFSATQVVVVMHNYAQLCTICIYLVEIIDKIWYALSVYIDIWR